MTKNYIPEPVYTWFKNALKIVNLISLDNCLKSEHDASRCLKDPLPQWVSAPWNYYYYIIIIITYLTAEWQARLTAYHQLKITRSVADSSIS